MEAKLTLQNECILLGDYTSKHCVPWSSDELEDITLQDRYTLGGDCNSRQCILWSSDTVEEITFQNILFFGVQTRQWRFRVSQGFVILGQTSRRNSSQTLPGKARIVTSL